MIVPLRIRDSIATTLLKVIFSLYLVVTIIITAVQMTSEFRHTSDLILKEIEELANSFGPGIATALWTYNTNGLNSILSGMQVNPTVIGVKIDDGSEKYAIWIIFLIRKLKLEVVQPMFGYMERQEQELLWEWEVLSWI